MTSHPLDQAIARTRRFRVPVLSSTRRERLAELYTGAAIAATRPTVLELTVLAVRAAAWASTVGVPDPWAAVRAEFDRAYAKHRGLTPLHSSMSDDDRAAILLEEVGEVARACTPDARTEVGHAGDLAAELVQVATMALTWAQAIINAQPAGEAGLGRGA